MNVSTRTTPHASVLTLDKAACTLPQKHSSSYYGYYGFRDWTVTDDERLFGILSGYRYTLRVNSAAGQLPPHPRNGHLLEMTHGRASIPTTSHRPWVSTRALRTIGTRTRCGWHNAHEPASTLTTSQVMVRARTRARISSVTPLLPAQVGSAVARTVAAPSKCSGVSRSSGSTFYMRCQKTRRTTTAPAGGMVGVRQFLCPDSVIDHSTDLPTRLPPV